MNMQQAIMSCLSQYVTFSGRSARSEYWYFVLFNFLCGLVLGAFDAAILNAPEGFLSNICILLLCCPVSR